MSEKKSLVVNCEVCDARKIQEGSLSEYDRIVMNASLILVDGRSKEILNKIPAVCNVDCTLEAEGEVPFLHVNGNYEITADTVFGENTLLYVNGNLVIEQGAGENLEKLFKAYVNGNVKGPKSVAHLVPVDKLLVNGSIKWIPDEWIEMEPVFPIGKYFPLRARKEGKYYVEREVILTDREVDIKALREKNSHFETASFLVREEFLADTIGMVDERVAIEVVPEGYAFVDGDTALDEELLQKYGNRLYINGDFRVREGCETCLSRLEGLKVRGSVKLLKRQQEAFSRVNAEYKNLIYVKGRYVANMVSFTVDQALLDGSPDGVEIGNCVSLKVEEDVKPESILERLTIGNCVRVFCSQEQRSALSLVCGNVVRFSDKEEEQDTEEFMEEHKNSKVVNADVHIL